MEDDKIHLLPDGSACFTASFPLPKDHWLYDEGPNNPPSPLKIATSGGKFFMGWDRKQWKEMIQAAARYAIRTSTMNGKVEDFDPDAMVQNFVVAMLGYNQ